MITLVISCVLVVDAPQVPEAYDITCVASHPLMKDAAAFCFGSEGEVYLAETQRQDRGVEDNRNSPFWLVDDLASRTVEDRYAVFEKWAHKRDGGINFYRQWADDVIRLRDTDGDGVFDERTHFAGPFNEVLDGGGAGLMQVGDDLWYTNIPHLWRLTDADGDGQAESQTSLYHGFGVRVALRGHDMHGLVMGPDGRMYWSIGDRGYHVERPDGDVLEDPHSGAVFRCEPDGSNLEVFHKGLRNPQELAFDRWGDLFTGDNNSDSEDRARVVFVAEGGETGWDMAYQTLTGDNDRGPWVQEGLWKMDHPGRPAWSLPPLAYIGSGPSGLMYLPGPGHDDRYEDRFLLCDFRGTPEHSSVLAFGVEPKGAGFEVVDIHPFMKGVLCTDVDMGWDGAVYVIDWVQGWGSTETGRIWRASHQTRLNTPEVRDTAAIIREGFANHSVESLADLLKHVDMRLRVRAQWEMAERGMSGAESLRSAAEGDHQLARLHGVWGLGTMVRRGLVSRDMLHPIRILLHHDDSRTRAEAARVLGDVQDAEAVEPLIELAFDPEARVAYQSLISLGKIGDTRAIDAAAEVLWAMNESDPWLRHACVMALSGCASHDQLVALLGDASPSIRLGAVLALRRQQDPAVSLALQDPDPFVAAEAARAIHDAEIESAMDDLAKSASHPMRGQTREATSFGRRAVEAATRRGLAEDAEALARMAADDQMSDIVRLEAARSLADWPHPGPRDRVTGRYRAIAPRDVSIAARRVAPHLLALTQEEGALGEQARAAASSFDLDVDDASLMSTLADPSAHVATRVDCLSHLTSSEETSAEAIDIAVLSGEPRLHAAAILNAPSPEKLELARAAMKHDDPIVIRAAYQVVAREEGAQALEAFRATVTPETELDFLEATMPDALTETKWSAAVHGGDPQRGRKLFRHHPSAACVRCHQVDGRGGIAGPSLQDVGSRLSREELLQSMIDPQAVVAAGYGSASAMPSIRQTLSPSQVRDIVAYLDTCRAQDQ